MSDFMEPEVVLGHLVQFPCVADSRHVKYGPKRFTQESSYRDVCSDAVHS